MSIRTSVAIAAFCLLCSSDVIADGIWNPVATSGAVWGDGINNAQGMSNSGPPPTPCAQDGLDFTKSCNAILFVVLF